MAKNKTGRPSWFKLFLHHKPLIDAVSNEAAGKAFKALLQYFENREILELDPLSGAVFAVIKPDVDEAFADFLAKSEKNRRNVLQRWEDNGIPGDTTGNQSLPVCTEVRSQEVRSQEVRSEREDGLEDVADKPPNPTHFSPPSVDDVREYCDEQGYTTVDPERFVSYYKSINWMVGRTPMADWRAAVQAWYRKDADKSVKIGGHESGIDRLARLYNEEFGE